MVWLITSNPAKLPPTSLDIHCCNHKVKVFTLNTVQQVVKRIFISRCCTSFTTVEIQSSLFGESLAITSIACITET
jgi:hypothetical protein